jgi:hypothetical protein
LEAGRVAAVVDLASSENTNRCTVAGKLEGTYSVEASNVEEDPEGNVDVEVGS